MMTTFEQIDLSSILSCATVAVGEELAEKALEGPEAVLDRRPTRSERKEVMVSLSHHDSGN